MDKQRVILRADGNSHIGFGHIYRLLALAESLKDHYYLAFALYKTTDFIEQEIRKYCNEIIILPGELPFKTPDEITQSEEIAFDLNNVLEENDIVVLDGYYFGTAYQKSVKQKKCKLVCVDDLALNYFVADAVINHAPGVEENLYKKSPDTRLYSGLNYAILREPFLSALTPRGKDSKDVFISLGGSDYFQITSRMVSYLLEFDQFKTLHIMCSSSFPEIMMQELTEISNRSSRVKMYQNLTAMQVVGVMDTCQYAFVSASTVLLETYSRGLTCFTGFYTNNQLLIYNGFLKENKAKGLGNLKDLTKEIIEQALTGFIPPGTDFQSLSSATNLQYIFSNL